MVRNYNTDGQGNSWKEEMKLNVWQKGRVIPNFEPKEWRWDVCGKVMQYSEFGNRESEHGWEIDHIDPVANGGTDKLDNLQPLNWKNNTHKGDLVNWKIAQE
jgi:hypothetical protein